MRRRERGVPVRADPKSGLPGEYAEVELCVDSCGQSEHLRAQTAAPLLSAAQKAQAAMRLRPLPALLERTCIPKRRV